MSIRWIHAFADVPYSRAEAATAFWSAVIGGSAGTAEDPEFVPLLVPEEDTYLWVQRLRREDDTSGWHVDLAVEDLSGQVEAAVGLGAVVQRVCGEYVSLRTRGGQSFCCTVYHGERHPAQPRTWPDGRRSRFDQICLDIPRAQFEDEATFWEQLTGWERRPGRMAEFDYLLQPRGVPIRLLLQRIGEDQTCGAHADLSADHVATEARRHQSLGASATGIFEHWTTMRDPAGLTYCITDRVPQPA